MTIQEILNKTYSAYKLSPLDAEILLSLAVNMTKEYILAHPEKKLAPAQIKKYFSFVRRRSAGEPIAYITGEKEFFGLDFVVSKNVLIPRPETELLVECALKKIHNTAYKIPASLAGRPDTIIDVGTGSGNIIISIAKNIPRRTKNKISLYAIDISEKYLEVARKNAKKNKVEKNIKFIQSNLLEYFLKNKIEQKNVLILANLPYVSDEIYKKNKNNLEYEPKQALISSNKGLNHYIRLIKEIRKIDKKCHVSRVTCCIEISPEQKPEISRIIGHYLPKSKAKFFKDLAGKWRMTEIEITS